MIHEIQPHRFDNHYIPGKQPETTDFILHFKGNSLLMKTECDEIEIPQLRDLKNINKNPEFTFLFTLDSTSCFLLWDETEEVPQHLEFQEIGFFRTIHHRETGWIAIVAYHLHNWYAEHRFCGKCGSPTHHKTDERAIACMHCGTVVYPKISPAIIVAITSGNKILLARNANFKGGWYSLIAGYVDVGETLEETVMREVKEEIGINVSNIRYYKSQPWALSGSMMVGFTSEADDQQPIEVDGKEITTADWFTRDNLPAYPSNASIAGEMIEKFAAGKL